MKNSLYFIAILPPKEIQREVTAFKQYAAKHFQSSRALTSPPHITPIPPFGWPEAEIKTLSDSLRFFAKTEPAFYLSLQHFDTFRPRVIFVDIGPSEELVQLQEKLSRKLEQEFDLSSDRTYGFHPHMTVAFKDLKRDIFPKAWKYFENIEYERFFLAKDVTLLKHDGKRWIVQNVFLLQNK